MTNLAQTLQKGDLVRIVSPAKTIDSSYFMQAKSYFENLGYVVKIGKHAMGKYRYFSGTDEERLADMQEALNDEKCKLILCSRGGYGSVRIVNQLDWTQFSKHPKWFCGFSDISYFLSELHRLNFPSIHGTMPLNFTDNTPEALNSMLNVLEGRENRYTINSNPHNICGSVSAEVVGGNLSVLYSLLGTPSKFDYKNKILFIEDVGEQRYAIDRMLYSFKNAGVFKEIKALIVGGMTELRETPIPTEFSIEEIVLNHLNNLSIPVCFDFPVGHFNDNRAMVIGKNARLSVMEKETLFVQ